MADEKGRVEVRTPTEGDVAAVVLAGGRSTRMGADKAFVTLDHRTLLARALQLARSVTRDVRVVGLGPALVVGP